MSAPPPMWEIYTGRHWRILDDPSAVKLEAAFVDGGVTHACLSLTIDPHHRSHLLSPFTIDDTFDVEKMKFREHPLRRDNDRFHQPRPPQVYQIEFYDQGWIGYAESANDHLNSCRQVQRCRTRIYIDDDWFTPVAYNIDLRKMEQTNHSSWTKRGLRNTKEDAQWGALAAGSSDQALAKVDCSYHRDEFVCPITQEVMRDPVVAADGFTYERDAVMTAFWNKRFVSPMTNKLLENETLIPNHTLRQIMQNPPTEERKRVRAKKR